MLRSLAGFFFVLSVAACGGDSGPSRVNVDGAWVGSFQFSDGSAGTLSLTLQENAGNVTGNGSLGGGGGSAALTATGTCAPPSISLSMHSSGFEDLNFSGTVAEASMTGTLNGSGFQNTSVTFRRQ